MHSPAVRASCAMTTTDKFITQPLGRYIHITHRTHDDGMYRASIASRDKNTQDSIWPTYTAEKSSSTSFHPSATKVICEELRSHTSRKEWTRSLRVLQAAMLTAEASYTQPRYDTSKPQCQCHIALSLLAAKLQRRVIFGRPYYRSSLWYSVSSVVCLSVCCL